MDDFKTFWVCCLLPIATLAFACMAWGFQGWQATSFALVGFGVAFHALLRDVKELR